MLKQNLNLMTKQNVYNAQNVKQNVKQNVDGIGSREYKTGMTEDQKFIGNMRIYRKTMWLFGFQIYSLEIKDIMPYQETIREYI